MLIRIHNTAFNANISDGCVQGASGAEQTDLNLLYWSEETGTVDISALEGRCYVR